jgi:hypothetical protein
MRQNRFQHGMIVSLSCSPFNRSESTTCHNVCIYRGNDFKYEYSDQSFLIGFIRLECLVQVKFHLLDQNLVSHHMYRYSVNYSSGTAQ